MMQLPSTDILHRTLNKANTQFGLLEGMHALHSLQKWLRAQEPGPNQQRQPSTSSVIAPLKTMWSIELSDDEDNPLARNSQALQMTSHHLSWMQILMMTTMSMTHSHLKIKNDGEFVEALVQLGTLHTTAQSVEENKRTRMQSWATEQRCTKQPADQQQLHQTKCIQPNNRGKIAWSVVCLALVLLLPAELA